MKLLEYEGKALFRTYGIRTPVSTLIDHKSNKLDIAYPVILKSQVAIGDRMKKGAVIVAKDADAFSVALSQLFDLAINGVKPDFILVEELISFTYELYVSISYSSEFRSPVLSLNQSGGTGITNAIITPIDLLQGLDTKFIIEALRRAQIVPLEELCSSVSALWKLFYKEHLTLAEINPLFITKEGKVIAGDAKVVRDDAMSPQDEKPFVSLGGDIAVIASGGGASMLNIDIIMRAGGIPANYVEYSGNPPAALVEELTLRVLSQSGLKGAWVVGGTANFTDIYETMLGFVAGLRRVTPKPAYPIVIRRDGPRQAEAKVMLEKFAKEEGFTIEVYGPELSMSASALRLIELMKK